MRFCTLLGDGSTEVGVECQGNAIVLGERHASGIQRYRRIGFCENDSPLVSDERIISGFFSVNGSVCVRGTPDPKTPELLRLIQMEDMSMILRIITRPPEVNSSFRRNGFLKLISGRAMEIARANPQDRKTSLSWMDVILAISPGAVIKVSPLGVNEEKAFVADFRTGRLFIRRGSTLVESEYGLGSHIGHMTSVS